MSEVLNSELYRVVNVAVLALLLVWGTYTSARLLRGLRTVLKANTELLTILNQSKDIMVEQQAVLGQTHKAALFWYALWLQEVGKR